MLASVLSAGLTQMAFTTLTRKSPTITYGASGAVFGVLLGFAMLFPKRIVVLILPPIPMPAPVFAAIFVLIELYLGVTGSQEGVGHFAHLGGLVGALLYLRWLRPKQPAQ